jgi:hypothetical protein
MGKTMKIYRIYRSQFINGVVCDVVLASDAKELEKELVAWKTRSNNLHDTLEKESAKLRDEITSLRVQLGAIGEFVKDRVNTALEMK